MGKKSRKGNASSDKKKKGPKGKRARAKAKLERQWGEEMNEDDFGISKTKRVGKSRLLSRNRTTVDGRRSTLKDGGNEAYSHDDSDNKDDDDEMMPFPNETADSDDDDDDDNDEVDDEDEEEMDLVNGGAFSKLLQTIRNKKKDKRMGAVSSNGIEDSDSASSNEEDVMVDMEDTNIGGDDNGDDDVESGQGESVVVVDDDDQKGLLIDLFEARFSKEPFPEDDEKREEMIQTVQKQIKKIAVPHIHPMLELQVSKQLLSEIAMEEADGDKTDSNNSDIISKESWKKLGKSYFGCNRDILKKSWKEKNNSVLMTPWQSVLYPFLSRYADCLIGCDSSKKRKQVSSLASLHIVNHVLTSRGRIQHQNRRIKAIEDRNKNNNSNNDDGEHENTHSKEEEEEPVIRDQGYTRPTCLVLLPTRGTCHSFLHHMLEILGASNQVPNEYMDRFNAEYGPPETAEEDDQEGAGNNSSLLQRRRKKVLEEKGFAWQELFGDDVNDDDDFKIGVTLNANKAALGTSSSSSAKKKKSNDKLGPGGAGVNVKLYTDFYSSDIIIASPLGLKMAISSDSNEGDCDFLSSIEICLMDRSDVMFMQNWDHVNDVLEHLNQLPANNNETDFARVREYFLVKNQAENWRQLILLTDVLDPAILSSFKRFAKSHSGLVKTRQRVAEEEGSIANVIVPVRQIFQRIPVQSIATMSEDRMKYIVQKILPSILQNVQKHTLIYTPSYFDFVLIRNYLIKNDAQFVAVTEYSRVSETSRGRARFQQGRKPLLLYTGRAHFFFRHKIKGVRNLIFFGLPEHANFYSDLVGVINEGLEHDLSPSSSGDVTSCTALFTRYEAHALERIVGTSQSNRMIKGEKAAFIFVS